MKRINSIIFISLSALMVACNAGEKKDYLSKTEKSNGVTTSTFKVWGNCDMCKETIESSLKLNGVINSAWNVESKLMTVSYDDKIISLDSIQKNISLVGYDNEKYKGNDLAYDNLHTCCQYDRK
jgi:mercuric ion binding protein